MASADLPVVWYTSIRMQDKQYLLTMRYPCFILKLCTPEWWIFLPNCENRKQKPAGWIYI